MNTMTMANALKAVFGAQTLTTASYFPACAQDGTPSGVISAANLASVLGVGGFVDNGVQKLNILNAWSGAEFDVPDGLSMGSPVVGLEILYGHNLTYKVQVLMGVEYGKVIERHQRGGVFSEWRIIIN